MTAVASIMTSTTPSSAIPILTDGIGNGSGGNGAADVSVNTGSAAARTHLSSNNKSNNSSDDIDDDGDHNILIGQYLQDMEDVEEELMRCNYSSNSGSTVWSTQRLTQIVNKCSAVASSVDQLLQRQYKAQQSTVDISDHFSPGSATMLSTSALSLRTATSTSPSTTSFGASTVRCVKQNIYLLYLAGRSLFQQAIAKVSKIMAE